MNLKHLKKEETTAQKTPLLVDIGKRTLIMGILNVTPDSFSDGGSYNSLEAAVQRALEMEAEGADIIDIGGESTRPGSSEISAREEQRRVIPIIAALRKKTNLPISIDTYKAKVAKAAIEAGATMVNDVWGLQKDANMAQVVARAQAPVVMMHNQLGTDYQEDIISAMQGFFEKSLEIASVAGISKHNLILDPGIGFGKTPEQNIEVMSRLKELKSFGLPLLLGTSRKSMIGHILDLPISERLEGTLATNVLGIAMGVDIIRVHDVEAHVRSARVTDAIIRS